MISVSLDDRSFVTGVETTASEATRGCGGGGGETSAVWSEPTMDTTQSAEEQMEATTRRRRSASPLKISYEKPRVCFLHYKTMAHVLGTCLTVVLVVETSLIIATPKLRKTRSDPHEITTALILNTLAIVASGSHVLLLIFRRKPSIRSAVFTFWCSLCITGLLSVSGYFIWNLYSTHFSSVQVPIYLHFLCIVGSLIALAFAGMSVYVENRASQYAVTY